MKFATRDDVIGTLLRSLHLNSLGRYWGNSGQSWILARDGLSAFDP